MSAAIYWNHRSADRQRRTWLGV